MNKNPLALAVYRAVKAANDDGSKAGSAPPKSALTYPLPVRSGWDPFEVWRTRIRVVVTRGPIGKR